jgi:hypothetical protein
MRHRLFVPVLLAVTDPFSRILKRAPGRGLSGPAERRGEEKTMMRTARAPILRAPLIGSPAASSAASRRLEGCGLTVAPFDRTRTRHDRLRSYALDGRQCRPEEAATRCPVTAGLTGHSPVSGATSTLLLSQDA